VTSGTNAATAVITEGAHPRVNVNVGYRGRGERELIGISGALRSVAWSANGGVTWAMNELITEQIIGIEPVMFLSTITSPTLVHRISTIAFPSRTSLTARRRLTLLRRAHGFVSYAPPLASLRERISQSK